MFASAEKVAILHAGGDEDLEIKDFLLRLLSKRNVQVECQPAPPSNNKDVAISRTLRKYMEASLPLVVVISLTLFETVWSTSSKTFLLTNLLSYPTKKCLHVWARNMDSLAVRKYSSALAKNVGTFRTVMFDELRSMSEDAAGRKIVQLLNDVEDDTLYQKNYIAKSAREDTLRSTAPSRPIVVTYPRQRYTPAEASKYMADEFGRSKLSRSRLPDVQSSKFDPYVRLADLPYLHYFKLADFLDHPALTNYKDLAVKFGFTDLEIQHFGLAINRGHPPTEEMIRTLIMRKPELTVKDFEQACVEIQRNDVVSYIREAIYRS